MKVQFFIIKRGLKNFKKSSKTLNIWSKNEKCYLSFRRKFLTPCKKNPDCWYSSKISTYLSHKKISLFSRYSISTIWEIGHFTILFTTFPFLLRKCSLFEIEEIRFFFFLFSNLRFLFSQYNSSFTRKRFISTDPFAKKRKTFLPINSLDIHSFNRYIIINFNSKIFITFLTPRTYHF